MNNKFSKRLVETTVHQVPPMDENGNPVLYSGADLDKIEAIVKPLLNVEELKAYDNFNPKERSLYLNGFAVNIKEWQDAKEAANNPQELNGGMPGMPGMELPDDGLDHWQPAKKSNDNNDLGQSKQDNMVFSDLEDEMDKLNLEGNDAENAAKESRSLQSNSQSPEEVANNTQSIALSAQQIADAALAAARAAQDAVNQADENAQASGKSRDVQNTDKAQVQADAAQSLANQAQELANQAQELADQAQAAAELGDMQTAAQKSKEAYDAAMDAADKMKAAQINAKSAIRTAKQTDPNNKQNSQGLQASSNEEIDGMNGLQAAQNAQQSADAAQNAANQAQAAADAAQEKADADGSPKSQAAANKAQLMANQAQAAADAAQDAADAARLAARQENDSVAQQQAKIARDNGQSAQQSAQEARQQAGQQSLQGSNMNESDSDPVLKEADTDFDPNDETIRNTKVDYDLTFGGNDFAGDDQEMIDKLREIAKKAGQPLDSDDYVSPEEYGSRKFQEALPALRTWKPHGEPGKDGNPPTYIEKVMSLLFESDIDWRTKVEDFLTDKAPAGKTDVWAKRRMGLDPSHPLYTGRYQHPNERTYEKKSGLAQVFFLVDASGSMGVKCGDGVNIFKHIMSELIQIELSVRIKRSAYATFNTGPIAEDDIFTWTYQDASDEDELMGNFVLPVAGGGTSAIDGIKSIQEYDEIYSTEEPWTLLIIVTDGGDNYTGLKDICNDPELVEHMIWVITATGEDWFKSKCEELKKQGVPEDHIICVDINKEWGVTREMVDKHNRR